MTEWLHFHFSLSYIGEGNGNPLQCSCLENPRDGGAWWAAIYGVAQSQTQLKRLSSSSSVLRSRIARVCGNIFILWKTSVLFSIVIAPTYILTNSIEGYPFLHTLSSICYLLFYFIILVASRGLWDLSSLTRDQTWAPEFGVWNLSHCTTKEVSISEIPDSQDGTKKKRMKCL